MSTTNRIVSTIYVTDCSVSPSVSLWEFSVELSEEGLFYSLAVFLATKSPVSTISIISASKDSALADMRKNALDVSRALLKKQKILIKEVRP